MSMSKNMIDSIQKSDAKFLGWQENPKGTPVALYTITAPEHPSFGSTVSENTLREFRLQIPQTPIFQEPLKII